MAHRPLRTGWRKAGLYFVILVALCLVSTVAVVVARDDEMYDVADVFPEPVTVNPDKQPKFDFPVALRTEDLALNRFVDRFFRLAAQAKYSEVKLMISNRSGDELLPARFEDIFNAMKEVRIKNIRRLPEMPDVEGPAWLIQAEYDLEPYAARSNKKVNKVQMCVAMEGGSYRIGPFSREERARLAAYDARNAAAAASQPASDTSPALSAGDTSDDIGGGTTPGEAAPR